VLMIQIDKSPFLEYGQALSDGLRTSLIRGCLMMAAGYLLFTIVLRFRKDKDKEQEKTAAKAKTPLVVQMVSMVFCAALALLFFGLRGALGVTALIFGGLLAAVSVAHLLRILLWVIGWFSKRPISSYAAQAIQFFSFLLVFLSIFGFVIYSGYQAQVQLSLHDELRTNAMFAGLHLSGVADAHTLDFGEHSQLYIINQPEIYTNDLFLAAWQGRTALVILGTKMMNISGALRSFWGKMKA